MAPLSRERFEALLDRLSQRETRQFIADLYAARGWKASVEGERVHAVRGTQERRLAFDSTAEGDAAEISVLESEDVYLMARYSIDRATCDALCREYFDQPFHSAQDPPAGAERHLTGVTVALVLLLVAGGLVVAGSGWFGPTDADRPSGPSPSPATAASREPQAETQPLPRGVTEAGVEDSDALARAHQRALDGKGYVLVSNRTVRYTNGTVRSRLALRVRLAANRTYLASVATEGEHAPRLLGNPPARATFWSNGTTHARRFRQGNETTYNTFEPPGFLTWMYWVRTVAFGGRHSDNPLVFYSAVFGAVPTRLDTEGIANGTRYYRLVDDGSMRTRSPRFTEGVTGVRNATLAATVDGRGLVRSLTLRYTGRADGETVRVLRTVRYDNVGKTAVVRPAWFERAAGQENA